MTRGIKFAIICMATVDITRDMWGAKFGRKRIIGLLSLCGIIVANIVLSEKEKATKTNKNREGV